MAADGPGLKKIVFPAKLSAMERLPAWICSLADEWSIDDRTEFAIHLCLEEAVSNIIRHGYAGGPPESVVTIVCNGLDEELLSFTIEDGAVGFNPLEVMSSSLLDENGEIPLGGRGIRLLRGFADSLRYEAVPNGNRLHLGFRLRAR